MTVSISEPMTYEQSTNHPSSILADRFNGVLIPDDATTEMKQNYVNFFVEMFHLLERTGEFDHTNDWDFHVGVELWDGRKFDHFGDGAEVDLVNPRHSRAYLRITTIHFPEDGEESLWPFHSFRVDEDNHDAAQDRIYHIPVTAIRQLAFGYCT